MKKLEQDEIRKAAEEEHKRFVDFMCPAFGFSAHPGYCKIEIRPLLIPGSISTEEPPSMYLNDDLSLEEAKYATWHESSHFLHLSINGKLKNAIKNSPGFRAYQVGEFVAELGAFFFLDYTEGLTPEAFERYGINSKMNSHLEGREINAAISIVKTDRRLLGKLARMNYKSATSRINRYLRLNRQDLKKWV